MSFTEDLALLAPKPKGGSVCLTCAWYSKQPESVQQAFDGWIAARNSCSQLARTAERHGLQASSSAFLRHYKNDGGKHLGFTS